MMKFPILVALAWGVAQEAYSPPPSLDAARRSSEVRPCQVDDWSTGQRRVTSEGSRTLLQCAGLVAARTQCGNMRYGGWGDASNVPVHVIILREPDGRIYYTRGGRQVYVPELAACGSAQQAATRQPTSPAPAPRSQSRGDLMAEARRCFSFNRTVLGGSSYTTYSGRTVQDIAPSERNELTINMGCPHVQLVATVGKTVNGVCQPITRVGRTEIDHEFTRNIGGYQSVIVSIEADCFLSVRSIRRY